MIKYIVATDNCFVQPVNVCFWCFSYVHSLTIHDIQEGKSAGTCIKLVPCIQHPVYIK